MQIIPQPDPISQPYWDAARERQLCLQHCGSCENVWHPPTPICPKCQAKNFAWKASAGLGSVYSFTVVHHAAHVAVKDRTPYAVVLVTLDEGPRVVANLLNCDPQAVRVGMRVKLTFQEVAPEVVLPQFTPA